jgi:FKBP-type peptidyl-prolyl cis-trans isomerase
MAPARILMVVCGALVVAAAVALAVGVSDPQLGSLTPIQLTPTPTAVRPMPEAPRPVPADAFVPAVTGWVAADVMPGAGSMPVAVGHTVVFDFVAWQDGTRVAGTSYTRPEPTRLYLTEDETGWIAALAGMTAGGVRQVKRSPDREPDARMVIEATVHEVLAPPAPVEVETDRRVRLPSGIEIADLVVGPGVVAESGQRATFEYAVFTAAGAELDSSWRRASPVRVDLGRDRLVFEPVLLGMTVGTRRQAWVPPAVAFPQGPPPTIDPDQTLVLVVELTAITPSVNNDDASHTDGTSPDGH